jgi:hypothetical protein
VARASVDGDIVAELGDVHITGIASALGDSYYTSEERVRNAMRRKASFNIIHLATMLRIDIFVSRNGPLDLGTFERSRPASIGGGTMCRSARQRSHPRCIAARMKVTSTDYQFKLLQGGGSLLEQERSNILDLPAYEEKVGGRSSSSALARRALPSTPLDPATGLPRRDQSSLIKGRSEQQVSPGGVEARPVGLSDSTVFNREITT